MYSNTALVVTLQTCYGALQIVVLLLLLENSIAKTHADIYISKVKKANGL